MSIDDNANKPKRPFGRSLGDFENLSEAEKKLIACAWRGEMCKLGEAVPKEPTPDTIIRPELIRFLALGGDENAPVHEKGVQLQGAWIGAAALDFEGVRLTTSLRLHGCNFQSAPIFGDSQGDSISLTRSIFPGLFADGFKLKGDLYLQNVRCLGKISLTGAEIGGDLSCTGGYFKKNPKDLAALICDRSRIGGGVFCNDRFLAIGGVRLLGSVIGGDLTFIGGIFFNLGANALDLTGARIGGNVFCRKGFRAIGNVCLPSATIRGDLDCAHGYFNHVGSLSLSCDRANIEGALYFRNLTLAKGQVSFAHARVATLADDLVSWPEHSLGSGLNYFKSSKPR